MLTEPVTIKSFDPIAHENCTVLILGTMPGNQSLEQNQYYGHPDNIFWDIMFRILKPSIDDQEIDGLTYADKERLLLQNDIALWDVLQYCNRSGNLYSNIRNEIKNDFETFFARHNKVKKLIFNGQKAGKYFDSCFKHLIEQHSLTKLVLPSTSSSNSQNAFKKLRQWRAAITDKT